MTEPFRVLITGSRGWPFPHAVHNRLSELWTAHTWDRPFIVVHGAARGADTHASDWVRAERERSLMPEVLLEEAHPCTDEDWRTIGRAAGHHRNARMIAAGADVCLAFILNGSPGASACSHHAERAGILTRQYVWPRV